MTDKPVQANFIDRSSTDIIKGVALIFMFIHHFFTMPKLYIDSISYPALEGFANFFSSPFKICVSIFAFLTGYFYYSKKKTFSYSLRKISDLWLNYLFTFALMLIPAIVLGAYDLSPSAVALEIFAVKRPVMVFCWYVAFYIASMLFMPLYHKLVEKNVFVTFALTVAVSVGALFVLKRFGDNNTYINLIKNIFRYFPCIASGYIIARYGLFIKLKGALRLKNPILLTVIYLIFMSAAFFAKHYISNVDFVFAPMFVFGLSGILNLIKTKKVFLPISVIGKYSLSMWFLHCLFFNCCKEYTQWFLYFPQNPVLVVLWGLAICLGASVIIMIPINLLTKLKNRLLWK